MAIQTDGESIWTDGKQPDTQDDENRDYTPPSNNNRYDWKQVVEQAPYHPGYEGAVFERKIAYKYNEQMLIAQLQSYVNSTYDQHYAQGKIQTTEFIIDCGDGIPHTRSNIIKYAQRYGRKEGRNRKDILKILHYALIMLYVHDLESKHEDK